MQADGFYTFKFIGKNRLVGLDLILSQFLNEFYSILFTSPDVLNRFTCPFLRSISLSAQNHVVCIRWDMKIVIKWAVMYIKACRKDLIFLKAVYKSLATHFASGNKTCEGIIFGIFLPYIKTR